MARPPKYDWKLIEADYKAGLDKRNICKKHNIEEKTLNNKVYEKRWVISGTAKAVMEGLSVVSGNLGQLEEESPELLPAIYDRIKVESEFDVSAGSLTMKIMKKLHTVVDTGKGYEKLNVGNGVQNIEPVEMTGAHYLDVANAAYRAKELLKGKESPATVQINNSNAVQNNITSKTLDDFYIE